mmetsp:Transcript_3779/g.11550  ORF Transcript_3779/g.11550 Transcript_3779/m.11550 type:complete len:212 (+) Transcript_3779:30-665(+)
MVPHFTGARPQPSPPGVLLRETDASRNPGARQGGGLGHVARSAQRPWQSNAVGNPPPAAGNQSGQRAQSQAVRTLSAPLHPAQLRFLKVRCLVRDTGGEEVCAVCLDDLCPSEDRSCVRLPCGGGHVFHLACVEPWFRKCSLCPKCRQPLRIRLPEGRATSATARFRMTSIDREVQRGALQYSSLEEEMRAMGFGGGGNALEQLHHMLGRR